MTEKPTYEELERRIQELERAAPNDRKELKACLEKAQKFRAAFEGSHDAITLTTKGGTVLDCNQRALELFCLQSKNDFYAKRPADFSPPMQQDGRRSVEASSELIHEIFREGEPHRFEWLHQGKTGEAFPAEVILTPVTIGNRKVLQAGIRDINERKQAETALPFETLRDCRFYRICGVISCFAYLSIAKHLLPCIFGKLDNRSIQVISAKGPLSLWLKPCSFPL